MALAHWHSAEEQRPRMPREERLPLALAAGFIIGSSLFLWACIFALIRVL